MSAYESVGIELEQDPAFRVHADVADRCGGHFLGLFGGILAFGPAGVFLGPLFVALFVALARIYEREMAPGAALRAAARVPETTLGGKLKEVIDRKIRRKQP